MIMTAGTYGSGLYSAGPYGLGIAPPDVPANIRAVAIGPDRIQITWDVALGADAYQIYRAGTGVIATVTETAYIDTTLPSSTRFEYRVRSVRDGDVFSNWSAPVSAITFAPVGRSGEAPSVSVLDSDHDLVALLGDYTRLTWVRSLWGAGSLQLTLPRHSPWAREIQDGWVLIPPDEVDQAFVVRQRMLLIEGQARSDMDITAPGLGAALGNPGRIVILGTEDAHDVQDDVPAETAMKHYVDGHAGPGAATERQLPNLVIAPNQARGENVTYHARFESVKEVISDIGKAGRLGWDITYDRANKEFVFDVIEGTDRSDSVFLDLEFESILRLSWLRSQIGRPTFAFVGGQTPTDAEGDPLYHLRPIIKTWIADGEPQGFARIETFLDQGSIFNTTALSDAGTAFLEEHRSEDTVEAQVNPYGSFQFGRDFFLGDIVTARDTEYGLLTEARVVEVHQTIAPPSRVPEVVISLGKPWPDVELRVEEEVRRNRQAHR